MRKILLLSIGVVFLLAGCGYRLVNGPHAARPVRSVEVPLFENRTMKPNLEALLADGVATELSQRGEWILSDNGDYVLHGTVLSYITPPASFSRRDLVREHRAEMAVEVTLLVRKTGRIAWKRVFNLQQAYPADDRYTRQENNEAAAIRYMAETLARDVRVALLEELPEGL